MKPLSNKGCQTNKESAMTKAKKSAVAAQVKESPKAVESQPEKEVAPQDLQDKVKALKQIINCHDLLNQGQFAGFNNKRIGEGLNFLSELHKQLIVEAQAHEKAYLIPELIQPAKGE